MEILLAGLLSLIPIKAYSSNPYPRLDPFISRATIFALNNPIEGLEKESLIERLDERLDKIKYKDGKTESRFRASMANYRRYNLEDEINQASERFRINRNYGLAFMIVESNLNPNSNSNNGCVGLGQTNRDAIRNVNRNFGTSFTYSKRAPKEDQIGAAFGFYSMKLHSITNGYGIEEEEAIKMAYMAYNAGGAPLHLALRRLIKADRELTWDNIEQQITPELLRSSSSYYKGWSEKALKRKVKIIKRYVSDASAYLGYLNQLENAA